MSAGVLEEILAGRLVGIPRMTIAQFEKYMQSGAAGEGVRCELIDGYPVIKNRAATGEDPMNMGTRHAYVVNALNLWLAGLVKGSNWTLCCQTPVFMAEFNLLEPDLAIVPGSAADYEDAYPSSNQSVLIIEVADSSVDEDRGTKLKKYAANAVPLYWIVNVRDEQIEVYQVPNRTHQLYEVTRVWHADEIIPLTISGLRPQQISVSAILAGRLP